MFSLSFPVAQKIGRYEICSKIGAGGMGEVYLGIQKETGDTNAKVCY